MQSIIRSISLSTFLFTPFQYIIPIIPTIIYNKYNYLSDTHVTSMLISPTPALLSWNISMKSVYLNGYFPVNNGIVVIQYHVHKRLILRRILNLVIFRLALDYCIHNASPVKIFGTSI
jgi:hypothetical protein